MRAGKPLAPFADRVDRVWGGLNELVRAAGDPDVALAAFFQVTPAQLGAWRAAEGRHRCPGTTCRGHACRGHASALIDCDPRVWMARDPAFCPAHMPPRQESTATVSDRPSAAPQIASRNASTEDDERPPAR